MAEEIQVKPGCAAGLVVAGLSAFIVVIFLFVMWPFDKTPRDKIGLSYGGGVFEGAHFQGIKQPGSGLFFNGWGDKLYLYPVTQRNYIISSRRNEGDVPGADFVGVTSLDGVRVNMEVATFFELNQVKVRKFHEKIGLKYHAWTDEGWDKMLNDSFRQQIESALQEIGRRHTAVDLYSNKQVLDEIQTEIGRTLKDRIAGTLGDNYFCGVGTGASKNQCSDFRFIVKRIVVPNTVAHALEKNRTSEIQVQTKKNEVEQRHQEALAIEELNTALSKAGDQYVLLKAIESGKIKFWILPSNTPVTVPSQP